MPAALLQLLLPILLGLGAKKGLGALLAKTGLSQGLKTAIPVAGEWAGFLGPGIYDAMKHPVADDVTISSNAGNLSMMHEAMNQPPVQDPNVAAMMSLLGQQSPQGGDDLMDLLGASTI